MLASLDPFAHLALVLSLFMFSLIVAVRLFVTRYLIPVCSALIVWMIGLSVTVSVLFFCLNTPSLLYALAITATFVFARHMGSYWQETGSALTRGPFAFELVVVFIIAIGVSEMVGTLRSSFVWWGIAAVGFLLFFLVVSCRPRRYLFSRGMSRVVIPGLLSFLTMLSLVIYHELGGSFSARTQIVPKWILWVGIGSAPLGLMLLLRYFLDLTISAQKAESLAVKNQLRRVSWSRQVAMLDRQRTLGLLSNSLQYELRQPLSSMLTDVKTFNRQLQFTQSENFLLAQNLDHLYHQSIRFYKQIANIRRVIGSVEDTTLRVDARSAISEVLSLMALEIQDQSIELRVNLAVTAELVLPKADLHHLILHGVMNALESLTLADGIPLLKVIEISTAWNGPIFEIAIADTGGGMSEEQIYQAGREAFSSKHGRVGLGLIMMRKILDQANSDWKFHLTAERFELILCFRLNADKDESVEHV